MAKCPRCGGQVLRNYGEDNCLQCGHDPDNGHQPSRPLPPRKTERVHKSGKQVFSASATQIRRRKRRLSAKGYSEKEIDEIIEEQINA